MTDTVKLIQPKQGGVPAVPDGPVPARPRPFSIIHPVREERWLKLVIYGESGAGKCLAHGELVPLADGRVVPAESLVGKVFPILAWEKDGSQVPAVGRAEENGLKEVFRVRMAGGREIVRTGNHPLWSTRPHHVLRSFVVETGERFFTSPIPEKGKRRRTAGVIPSSQTWVPVSEIQVGDWVLVPEQIHIEGSVPTSEDEVKLCAYLIADGCLTVRTCYSKAEGPVLEEMREIVTRFGCCLKPASKNTRPFNWAIVGNPIKRGVPHRILELVRQWGLGGKKSIEKTFPDWVWQLPNEQLALFLNRLYASDGSVYTRCEPGRSPKAKIEIGFSSKALIDGVEQALLRLGISGTRRARTTSYTGSDKRFASWVFTIHEGPEIQKFLDRVGVFGKDEAIRKMAPSAFPQPMRFHHLGVPEGYRWDRVMSVENLGVQPTVAICVPDYGTYLTTFVEHNSHLASTATEVDAMQDVLYIDVEAGDLTLQRWPGMDVVRLSRYREVNAIFEFLQRHCALRDAGDEAKLRVLQAQVGLDSVDDSTRKYHTVIIDSLSELQKLCMYQVTGNQPGKASLDIEMDTAGYAEWGRMTELIRLLVRSFRDLPIHTIFVCSEKALEDKNKRTTVGLNLTKALAGEVPGFMDVVGYLQAVAQAGQGGASQVERRLYLQPGHGFLAKSRLDVGNTPIIVNPHMRDLAGLIKK